MAATKKMTNLFILKVMIRLPCSPIELVLRIEDVDCLVLSPNEGPEKTCVRDVKQQPTLYVGTVLLSLAHVDNFSGFHLQDKQNASLINMSCHSGLTLQM